MTKRRLRYLRDLVAFKISIARKNISDADMELFKALQEALDEIRRLQAEPRAVATTLRELASRLEDGDEVKPDTLLGYPYVTEGVIPEGAEVKDFIRFGKL